jgi:hypothetical protein
MFSNTYPTCPACGKRLTGRADKKFCNDQCRSEHNNRNSVLRVGLVKRINVILRKNRNILMKKVKNALVLVPRDELQVSGFDFRFYTHCEPSDNGNCIYYCYDIGYIPKGKELELICKETVQ